MVSSGETGLYDAGAMNPSLIQPLFDGPLDVIGDLHGEIGVLEALLRRLGYDAAGRHPDGRRLVFVGDLIDRGEDSPAVIARVADLVAAGRAQCVLGNHELNLLRESRKEGNGWFFEAEGDHDHRTGHFLEVPRLPAERRAEVLAWLARLPLALERADLRVVHACWHGPAVDALRGEQRPLLEAYAAWAESVEHMLHETGTTAAARSEAVQWADAIGDRNARVPMLPALARMDAQRQSGHPVRVVTSGLERPTAEPFFAGGKWRFVERVPWWKDYDELPAVVFGHYWRWAGDEADAAARSRGPNLFAGHGPGDWLGPRGNAMCIDYSAGLRWRERAAGVPVHRGAAAALRWPERELVLEN